MMKFEAVIELFADLDEEELTFWIEQRWVAPSRAEDKWVFDDIDVARCRLIYDLRRDFDASHDAVPLMLSLIDQVYELRRNLSAMRDALANQPAEVRSAVLMAMQRRTNETPDR